jgi:1-acyl-sn-glycerol-3-phosphate acyltransferase
MMNSAAMAPRRDQVDVVRGREHLWSSRPCVFIFNHQSKLDPIIVMKLLREKLTGVAKKEAKNVPVFGQVFQLAAPGRVEVVVLPPVDTSDFSAQTLDEHVNAVRDQFVETLAQWPGSSVRRLPAGSAS